MNGIRPASPSEFEEIYAILETSFPPDERRAKEDQQALLQEECYTVYVLPDKETVAGFLTVWQFSDFAVVEHFAVNPAYRNQGLGGTMLAQLRSLLPCRHSSRAAPAVPASRIPAPVQKIPLKLSAATVAAAMPFAISPPS